MKISVIIPVYNAEKFLGKAIESVVLQEETGDVILVEDNSIDNSLQICREFEAMYDNIRLVCHSDHGNHGAGATRNLGVHNAECEYVAFLDADDYYLPKRFTLATRFFHENPGIDGVYEAVGVDFYDEQAREKWQAKGGKDSVTMTEKVPAEDLFEALVGGRKGSFHLNGLVVKKKLFERCGYFPAHLRLHQDTALFIQMAEFGQLIPGNIEAPVAMRTIHEDNRIIADYNRFATKALLWRTLFFWALAKRLESKKKVMLLRQYLYTALRAARGSKRFCVADWGLVRQVFFESARHPILSTRALAAHLLIKHEMDACNPMERGEK